MFFSVGPIFERELVTTPRRVRHFVVRASYLGLLFVLMWTAWQSILGFDEVQRQGDIPAFHALLFDILARTQLGLTLFAAGLYGATAVSHEKDRRTFVLLLVTRLSDSEIVLGKFASAVAQVLVVSVASLPVFFLLLVLGGVAPAQVLSMFAITVAGGTAAAALGVLLATWRDQSSQAVALTLLFGSLVLLSAETIGPLASMANVSEEVAQQVTASLSPFRALEAVVGGERANRGIGFFAVAFVFAAILLSIATIKLRDWNPRGEPLQKPEEESPAGDLLSTATKANPSRSPRGNPVLWREVFTRAYGSRPILIKAAYLIVAVAVVGGLAMHPPNQERADASFAFASGFLPLAIISLLLVNTQAVVAITVERDLGGLDLLLVTDITPREFVFGKLLGAFFNTKEMIAVPFLTLAWSVTRGWIGLEGFVFSTLGLAIVYCFSAVLGLHSGLRQENSRAALAHSLGAMFLLFVGVLLCLFLIRASGRFEAQWASFLVFIVFGSVALWISLSANAPSNAIALAAMMTPFSTFYCVIGFLVGDRAGPFLVGGGAYGFATLALLAPMLSEFDIATGRTNADT